ncbi:DUF317 domain-containing protein [Streptomyces sp. NPDC052101]|uniref:DUF317 domain-containing protein n=1 Tax=Streptomyces sp. NPDC052101 TaxID=3155763 RepID=UPI003419133F
MANDIEVALVAPCYLAGPGDPAWITVPLHRACGWTTTEEPLTRRVVRTSPDRQAELRVDPTPDDQWWHLHHAADADHPAWYASFGARTPVELIAAVLDALTDPVTPQATACDPLEPVRQAGWAWSPGARISPDGIAEIEHFTDHGSNSWFITAALSDDPENSLWQACFGGNTPDYLITAFTRTLADPSPLIRDPLSLPPRARRHTHLRTEQLPAGTVAFALEHRTAALAQRRAPSPATSTAPPAPPQEPRPRRAR